MMDFYCNRSYESFFTSLANLFLLKQEKGLAEKIRNYESVLSGEISDLVGKTGFVSWHIHTRIVEDISCGRYHATLYAKFDHIKQREILSWGYKDRAALASQVFYDEIARGRIINSRPTNHIKPAIITGISESGLPEVVLGLENNHYLRNNTKLRNPNIQEFSAMNIHAS